DRTNAGRSAKPVPCPAWSASASRQASRSIIYPGIPPHYENIPRLHLLFRSASHGSGNILRTRGIPQVRSPAADPPGDRAVGLEWLRPEDGAAHPPPDSPRDGCSGPVRGHEAQHEPTGVGTPSEPPAGITPGR